MAKRRKSGGKRKSSRGAVSVTVRRNPPKSFSAALNPVMQAVVQSGLVLAGMWGAGYLGKFVGQMIPKISEDTQTQTAFGQALVAAAATVGAAFVLPAKYVVPIGAGTFVAPLKTVVNMANIGFINDGLSSYVQRQRLASYPQPRMLPAGVSEYVDPNQAALYAQ